MGSLCLNISLARAEPGFSVKGYRVVGNTLLSAQRVDEVTAPHTGSQADFETIQKALEALEKAYIAAGYGSVRVELPEQELDAGIVTLQVIEGVLGKVVLESNPHFDLDNVTRSLPALRPGKSVNVFELNRNLAQANESSGKRTQVTFKRSPNARDVDASIQLVVDNPERWMALLDNSGNDATGRYRTGFIYQHGNVFNRDQALSVQAITSPDKPSEVSILGFAYKLPDYVAGTALDLSYSHSSVNSGRVAVPGGPSLNVSGSGELLGLRLSYALDPSAALEQRISAGVEWRAYASRVVYQGGGDSEVPDLSTNPLILSYSGAWKAQGREYTWGLSWLANNAGGNNGNTSDYNRRNGRSGASAHFQTYKFNASLLHTLPSDWVLKAGLDAQYSDDLLIAPEQFGLGGADSVRGFLAREVAGDQGWRLSLEAWAPAFSAAEWRLVPLIFWDGGAVLRNRPLPGEIGRQDLASSGLGLRTAWNKRFSARLDWGWINHGVADGSPGARAGESRLQATTLWVF